MRRGLSPTLHRALAGAVGRLMRSMPGLRILSYHRVNDYQTEILRRMGQ